MGAFWWRALVGLAIFGAVVQPGILQAQEEPEFLLDVQGELAEGDEQLNDGRLFDAYSFQVTSPSSLIVELDSNSFDTYLKIFNKSNNVIAENDDFLGATNSVYFFENLSPGTYTIKATNLEGSLEEGSYHLKVRSLNNNDRIKFEANQLFNDAEKIYDKNTRESLLNAAKIYNQIVVLLKKIDSPLYTSIVLSKLGEVYDNLGEYQKSLNYYQQALVLAIEINDRYEELYNLIGIGSAYYNSGNLNKAFEYCQKSLLLSKEMQDPYEELQSLACLGSVHYHLTEEQKALDYYKQVLSILRELDDPDVAFMVLSNIVEIYNSLTNKTEALNYYEQALSTFQDINNLDGEFIILSNLAALYESLGDIEKALDHYQQALPITKKIQHRLGEGRNLANIGDIYGILGDTEKALSYYEQALPILREANDIIMEGFVLSSLGGLYRSLENRDKAIDYYQQALPLFEDTENFEEKSYILYSLASLNQELGNYNKALKYYQENLIIDRKTENIEDKAITLNGIGLSYSSMGNTQKALEYYQQALLLSQKIDNLKDKGTILNNLGVVYNNMGEKKQALDYYQRALLIRQEIEDRSGEAVTLNNLGNLYNSLGSWLLALDYYQRALLIRQEIEDRSGEAVTLNNLGNLYLSQNPLKLAALENYQQALSINKEIGNKGGEASALNGLGSTYGSLGERRLALEYYLSALSVNREIGDKRGEATSLGGLAYTYEFLDEKQNAANYYLSALSVNREIGDKRGEATSLGGLTYLAFKDQNYSQANIYYRQAINTFNLINSQGLDDNLKIDFFDTYIRIYDFFQRSLVAENKFISALEVAEQSRARALIELLNNRFLEKSKSISSSKLSLNELKIIAKVHNSTLITYDLIASEIDSEKFENTELYIYVITPQGDVEFRAVDLKANDQNFSDLIAAARKTVSTPPPARLDRSGAAANVTGYQFSDFQVGDYVKLQGEFPTDEPWQIVALNTNSQTLTLDQTQREAPLENVSPNRIATKTDTSLQQLHQILIDPIADLLPGNPDDDVIFMPQGALFGIPFPALQDAKGEYLIEKHTILTSPSIQVLSQTAAQNKRLNSQPQNTYKALVVGNPYPYPKGLASLENAVTEAQNIGELLGVKPLLGKAATEAKVLEQMPQADILHFATHATFDDQNGIRSAIYLTAEPNAPDDDLFETPGRITAEEIFNQFENNPLNARLAVLSACDTGQGEITGDGVIGLSRSLIAAGVPSVIVSLWSVDDASSSELMTEFYRQWQSNGVDKATALRNAMLQTKAEYPEPYYWSAFTLIGEAE